MFKTHGVALHPGMGHSRGMFSCLCMATACFKGTTHRHVLPIFLRTILVVHVPAVGPHKPQGSASPHILGSVTTFPSASALPHDCASLPKQWPLHKTNKILLVTRAARWYVPYQRTALHANGNNLAPLRFSQRQIGCPHELANDHPHPFGHPKKKQYVYSGTHTADQTVSFTATKSHRWS